MSPRKRPAPRKLTQAARTARRRTPAEAPRRNVREAIYEAALASFESHGVRGTLMEDVAREAGVSRPAIYYYFPDKDALVLEVVVRQVRDIHRRIRREIHPDAGLGAMLEATLQTILISRTDQYVTLLTQPDTANLTARLVESDLVMGLQRELWYPLLESARERGELRTDRAFDDIIRWITFIEFAMITSGDSFDFNDEGEIRKQLEAFLLPALRAQSKR
jgi:AcrR family transcriptional regulator